MEALNIPSKQKAKLHRVAELLLVIYRTLVEMRYLGPEDVQAGSHDVSELMPLYESLGLAPAVIYLYSSLPYANPQDFEKPFFQGGDFADFRNKGDVQRGRDPLCNSPVGDNYKADNGPYMRLWYTPLSHCGWRQSIIIYDTRTDEICIVHRGGDWCADPNIDNKHNDRYEADSEDEDGVVDGCGASNDETEDGNANENESDGDEAEEEEDDDDEEDDGVIEEGGMVIGYDSRPAAAVLRDINRWYREHETPSLGQGQLGPWIDEDKEHDVPLSALYKQHSGPGPDFDGELLTGLHEPNYMHSEDWLPKLSPSACERNLCVIHILIAPGHV
ncbi:centromere kinetochore component CENP-T domain-containing protein [Apiospora rasikravindrae]|uniref:Centromere kinetochore component CENP-T domain-containing protein n=1 Tax=Apiospora rasikravindrae TaxID=990691 RepID=A0ABR1TWM0_9PEZI